MFSSLFRQNANAKIANNTFYQDTIVTQITKRYRKKTNNIFEISTSKLAKNS